VKTAIDWLTFRTQSDPFETVEAMRAMFGTAGDLLTFKPGLKGMDGWLRGGELSMAGDIALGRVDYGGESQRGWVRVNLSGEGCRWVQDWKAAEGLRDALAAPEIKRLDIALTTYRGEVTHDMVIEAHGRREFSSGGRQPHYRVIGGSDPRAGRTIYVGKRAESAKMLRCYEKGFEILSQVPESLRASVTHIEGNRVEEIYRVELELKNVDKHIPWTAFLARDEIFAAAYPFCASLMPGVDHIKLQTLPDFKPRADMETKLDHCRRAYGAILRTGVLAHGGDQAAKLKVLERICSDQPSRALIESGVLTVEHY
jgi:phage replication initiation protein